MGRSFSLFILILLLTQASCAVPIRQVDESKVRIDAVLHIPNESMKRGEEYIFVVQTEGSVNCYLGFRYMDISNEWVSVYLPSVISAETGLCKWTWQIPLDAKDGLAEVRAYVEKNGQTEYLVPDDFCIEVCKK